MNLKKQLKHWKAGAIEKGLWSDDARRASIVIETSDEAARAVLVDDHGGVRGAFKVPTGQLGEIIGAASEAWRARGAGGSLAIFIGGLRGRGEITPPVPPVPPGPGGHERIFMMQTIAAHAAFDAAAELAHLDEIGELPALEVELHKK